MPRALLCFVCFLMSRTAFAKRQGLKDLQESPHTMVKEVDEALPHTLVHEADEETTHTMVQEEKVPLSSATSFIRMPGPTARLESLGPPKKKRRRANNRKKK